MLKSSLPRTREIGAALIAGLLTLGLGGFAMSVLLDTETIGLLGRQIDSRILGVFVPFCALVCALVFESIRLVWRGSLPATPKAQRPLPRGWHLQAGR